MSPYHLSSAIFLEGSLVKDLIRVFKKKRDANWSFKFLNALIIEKKRAKLIHALTPACDLSDKCCS